MEKNSTQNIKIHETKKIYFEWTRNFPPEKDLYGRDGY